MQMLLADQQKAMQRFIKNQEKAAQLQAQENQQQQSQLAQGVTGAMNRIVAGMEKAQAREERGEERREVRGEEMAATKELTLWKQGLEQEMIRDQQALLASDKALREAVMLEAKQEEEGWARARDALAVSEENHIRMIETGGYERAYSDPVEMAAFISKMDQHIATAKATMETTSRMPHTREVGVHAEDCGIAAESTRTGAPAGFLGDFSSGMG
jgi:hypothetical protein